MEDDEEMEQLNAINAFKEQLWALERKARKTGGFLKVVSTRPTKTPAYAARMYRVLSTLGWDIPDIVPPNGYVCAFTVEQWKHAVPDWDLWQVIVKAKGRLAVEVIYGEAIPAIGQTFVKV